MAATLPKPRDGRPRVNGENCSPMVGAVLPKRENADEKRQFWPELGACLDEARRELGWTVEQLAAHLERDSKQVARWLRGEERTQVDAVFTVKVLQEPFVIALAKLARLLVEETVTIRRRA